MGLQPKYSTLKIYNAELHKQRNGAFMKQTEPEGVFDLYAYPPELL